MYTLILLFIAVVLVIGIFCVIVVCRDILLEERDRRKQQTPEKAAEDVPQPRPSEQEPTETAKPIVADVEQAESETVAAEAENDLKDPNAVVFERATETLEEKYLALSSEQKEYYDEIVKKAASVEGSKCFKNTVYEEYKVGKSSVVRLKIKRGVTVCYLTISNPKVKNYVSDKKVSAKQAPVVIKVTDKATSKAVVEFIDIAAEAIEQEKADKKKQLQQRRQQRRLEEKKAAAENGVVETE